MSPELATTPHAMNRLQRTNAMDSFFELPRDGAEQRLASIPKTSYSAFPVSCDSLAEPKPTFDAAEQVSSSPEIFNFTVIVNGVS